MTRLRRGLPRGGFALPAALLSLVLVSALVAGALFVATEELRAGRGAGADQRALAAAEWALDRAIITWDSRRNVAPVGRADTIAAEYGAPNDTTLVIAMRVQRRAVWMTATATRGGDGRAIPARHTVAASLRLVNDPVPTSAALTSSGAVVVDGGVVDGRAAGESADSADCPESPSAAGIRVPDASRVTCPSCAASSSGSGVFGAPAIDSSGITDSTFAAAVDATIASLVRRASIDLPAGTMTPRPTSADASCDLADPFNWGDPGGASPCSSWLPVIHVRGSVVLGAGAVGQGILVVDGSVRVEAGARFVGVVVARGDITVSGFGAEITGAVFAAPASAGAVSRITDGGSIRFEPCAVLRASIRTARLVRTPERWWVELR
jgi:hypothetical protein